MGSHWVFRSHCLPGWGSSLTQDSARNRCSCCWEHSSALAPDSTACTVIWSSSPERILDGKTMLPKTERQAVGRTAYAIVVVGLCSGGLLVVYAVGEGSAAAAIGIVTAGAIQVIAYWRLAGRLAARQDATRAWVGGMMARFAAFGAIATLSVLTELVPREALSAFAYTLIALVLLEAVWLALATGRNRSVER